MHILLVCAAVTSTVTLDGALEDDGTDYAVIEFAVPENTVEIEVEHTGGAPDNVLDWGLWGPEKTFRGWGGGSLDNAIVAVSEASHGYLPGPIPAGTWQLVIGKALIKTWPAPYSVTLSFKDAETLEPRPRAPFAPQILATERHWYPGDFHVHSRESTDATATLDEITALARQRGLAFVVLSDHNTVSHHDLVAAYQSSVTDILLVQGAEITTYGGHGNAFGLTSYIDHRVGLDGVSAQTILAEVRGQGALFSINHPAYELGDACIGCAWQHEDTDWDKVGAIEIHTGNYDLSMGAFTPRAIALWDQALDAGHRVTAIGGSDDHRAGIDLNPFQSPIGSPTTLVLADGLSQAAVIEGVRQGRAIVQLRGPGDPLVELTATGADGVAGTIGDTVSGAEVTLVVHVIGGDGLRAVIVQNGVIVDSVEIVGADWSGAVTYPVREAGDRFRVHVVKENLDVVITNHVYATYAPPADSAGCGCQSGGDPGALMLVLGALFLFGHRRRRGSMHIPARAQTCTRSRA